MAEETWMSSCGVGPWVFAWVTYELGAPLPEGDDPYTFAGKAHVDYVAFEVYPRRDEAHLLAPLPGVGFGACRQTAAAPVVGAPAHRRPHLSVF